MNDLRIRFLCGGLLCLWGCAQLEGPVSIPPVGVGPDGLTLPGLIEYAEVTHRIGPIDNPTAVRRLAQTKFNHLSLAYLRQLPEYKKKKNEIVNRAARERRRVISRPNLTPVQRQVAVEQIDQAATADVAALDSDPELLALAIPFTQKRDFFIPYGNGIVKASSTTYRELKIEEEVWATTATSTVALITAVDGNVNRTNIDLELSAVLARVEDPLPLPDS